MSEEHVDGALEGDVVLDFTGLFPPPPETIENTSTQDILEDIQNQITQLQSPDDSFAFGNERLDTHSETQAALQEEFSEAWSTIEEDKIRIQAAQDKADQADVNAGLALDAASEAVISSEIQYVLSIFDAPPPGPEAAWSPTSPERTPGAFIWMRTKVTRGNDEVSYSAPALITGNDGAPGDDGEASKTISLEATTQILTSPAAGGATSPTTATVTGTAFNTTISAWQYSVDGASFSATVPTGVSRTGNVVTVTGSTMTAKTIAVRMSDASGVADTLTVAKVLNGTAGTPGADAYTVLLSNEAHVFAGGTTAALAATTTSTVIVYKGSTQQSATVGTITGQVTGLTTSITSNGTTSPVITLTTTTSLTTKSGTLTVPVTVDGTTFTKTIAWSLSLTGGTGSQGASVTSIVSYFATLPQGSSAPATPGNVATPSAPWVATEPTYAPATELWRTERVAYSDETYSYTTPQKSSAWAAAVYVGNLNDAAIKGLVRVSSTDPGFFEGRIWWETYPAGDPKAGQVKAIKYSASASGPWVPYMLAANDILVPGSVKAGIIDTDDLTADAGFIRSLAVNEAVVSGANLLLEPSFARGGAGWAGAGDLRTIVTVPDGPNGSTSVMRITPTSNDQSVSNYAFGPAEWPGIDVEPGAVFRCRMVLRKVSGTAGLVRLRSGQFRSGQSSQWPLATSDLNLATATTGAWVTVEGTVTMLNDRDRMSMSIHLSGAEGAVVEVASASVVRMASGLLIVDGAITTGHLQVGSINVDRLDVGTFSGKVLSGATIRTAASGARMELRHSDNSLRAYNSSGTNTVTIDGNGARISAGTITGTYIDASAISGTDIDASTITGTDINAGTITGAVVRTTSTANRGIRLDGSYMRAWDSSGTQTFNLDASTGNLTVSGATITGGTIQTAASGSRIVLGGNSLQAYNSQGLRAELSGDGNIEFKAAAGAYVTSRWSMEGTSQQVSIDNDGVIIGTFDNLFTLNRHGLRKSSGTSFTIAIGNKDPFYITENYVNVGAGVGFRIQDDTTTSTAAAALPVSGDYRRLMRTTSLRRYKAAIETPEPSSDFLSLTPRTWFDRREVEDAGLDFDTVTEAECVAAGLRRIPGFVAEEVEAVNPLFCTYNSDGELEGLSYDRLAVAVHPVLKDLDARLRVLESMGV